MKRENIFFAAGALLATTSLTTTSFASTTGIVQAAQPVYAAGTSISMGNQFISAQAFTSTTSTSATIGPFNIYVKFALPIAVSGLSGNVAITGASFSAGPTTARAVVFGTGFTVESTSTSSNICSSVLTTGSTILLTTCDGSTTGIASTTVGSGGQTATAASTNGLFLSGVTINNLAGMATAGGTISLSNTMTVANTTVDSQVATVELTSRNGLVVTATAPTSVASIDVAASPSFTKLTSSSLSTVLANIQISNTSSFGTDLSAVITGAALYGGAEIRVTSASLTDDASSSVTLGATALTKTAAQYASGFVTFQITPDLAALTATFALNHSFNGTAEIDAVAAGTSSVTFTAPTVTTTGASVNVVAQAAVTGTAGALTRNGLSIDFNGVYPSSYAPTYSSYIRVVNTGTAPGTPTVVITNENTGVLIGTYTGPAVLAVGASAQYSIKDIETALAITPSASILYRARVGGSITGYAQHVIWNQVSGFFTDMSSRRTSVTGNN